MNGDGNFKMRCIDVGNDIYTKGKIYEVIDGVWKDDEGDLVGDEYVKTIDDINGRSCATWELVEEETPESIKKEIPVSERMRKIAESFGLELSEEFNIVGEGKPLNYGPYKFTERGLLDKDGCRWDKKMVELIRGIYTVEKLPWKPKHREKAWTVYSDENKNRWCNYFSFQENSLSCIALYKMGWLFRTEAEAEANKERVLKEMKEVMEND